MQDKSFDPRDANENDEHLIRTIGVFGLSANMINIIVGAGIFALPAIIASNMGASSIFAYLVCALLIGMIMLCFAEAGSNITTTGGAYTYIETAFGDYAGFLSGIFSIAATLFADAAVSNALANIMADAFPIFQDEIIRFLFLFILFSGLVTINVMGVKQGMGLIKFNTVAKLLPLLILITLGWQAVSIDNLSIDALPSLETIGQTSLILFFAFQGCETGIIVGGEVINPKSTIPKAIFISLAVVVTLYILIQTVCQGILGAELPEFKSSPLAESAKVALGTFGLVILLVGAGISMFGNLSGSILNSPRVLYALARDKVIPIDRLAKIHPKFATPYVSLILYGALGLTLAVTGGFEQLVVISSSSILILYLGVVLAVMKLRKSQPYQKDHFRVPGGLLIPIFSIVIILFFLSFLSLNEMMGTLCFIGLISVIYVLQYKFKGKND